MRVLISGSGGLVGGELKTRLRAASHEVVPLVRDEPAPGSRHWKPSDGSLDPSVFDGIDAVINLNGSPIGDRWTKRRRRLLYDSRVGSTRLLAETMAALPDPPPALVTASAIGYYGSRGDEILTEDSAPGDRGEFFVDLVSAWEEAAAPAREAGIRTVTIRSGMILHRSAGALGEMLFPFKLGIGGRLGSGDQWWSWISRTDEARAIVHLLESDLDGPFNLTSPTPVTNAEFVDVLGSVIRRPTLLPVPRITLQLILGRPLADTIVFTSARVLPERLTASGFQWEHADLRPALVSALERTGH